MPAFRLPALPAMKGIVAALIAIAGIFAAASPALALRYVNQVDCGKTVIHGATARWSIRIVSSTVSQPERRIVFRKSGDLVIHLPVDGYEYRFYAPNGKPRRAGEFTVAC